VGELYIISSPIRQLTFSLKLARRGVNVCKRFVKGLVDKKKAGSDGGIATCFKRPTSKGRNGFGLITACVAYAGGCVPEQVARHPVARLAMAAEDALPAGTTRFQSNPARGIRR
jgi:hypothetical protein